ncbi:MAG: hypothetical protein QNI84_02560 [Henriciella sp.]|nr:hypothetical protein [Henriciella sp.]
MKMQSSIAIGAVAALSACTTPGIDYEARLMASSPEAAETRIVAVERFRGPASGWFTRQFESMLANAQFDGAHWFTLADYTPPQRADRAGTYSGDIDVISYDWSEYHRTVKKCVEWDGLFDCETRAEVEQICLDQRLEVAVTPRLVDASSGQVVYSNTYFGEAHREYCDDVYDYHGKGYSKGHYHGSGHRAGLLGFADYAAPPDMMREALNDTLWPIRVDIAPRNATVRATFVTKALDPVVRADPRFEQAVDMAASNPFGSCDSWVALSAEYPQSPAIVHNMGACAEASTDYEAAQGLYGEAAELSVKYSVDGAASKDFVRALRKLSERRTGAQLIEELTGEAVDPETETPIG